MRQPEDREREDDVQLRTVYRFGPSEGRSKAEMVLAGQAIMEELGCNSRSKLKAYDEKLDAAENSRKSNVCALCERESRLLSPLSNVDNSPLVCEDCGVDYWMCVNFVFPPAAMFNKKHRDTSGS